MFFPTNIQSLIVLSGINNLALAFMSKKTSPVYNTFFEQSVYTKFMKQHEQGGRASLKLIADGVKGLVDVSKHKIYKTLFRSSFTYLHKEFVEFKEEEQLNQDLIKKNYQNILSAFERDIRVLGEIGRYHSINVHFFLQPLASYMEKKLSPEEKELFLIADQQPVKHWQILSKFLGDKMAKYAEDIRLICEKYLVY